MDTKKIKKTQNDSSVPRIISDEQSQGFVRHFLKGNNYIEGAKFIGCSTQENNDDEIVDVSLSPLLLEYLDNKETFADRMKAINSQVVEKELKPDIEKWKTEQKSCIICGMKEKVIEHFRWAARIGRLDCWRVRKFECWGKDDSNIPNAEELTRELVEEVFKPYGIKVEEVSLKHGGNRISATLKIE